VQYNIAERQQKVITVNCCTQQAAFNISHVDSTVQYNNKLQNETLPGQKNYRQKLDIANGVNDAKKCIARTITIDKCIYVTQDFK